MEFNPTSLAVGAVVILAIFCTGEVVGVTCPENYINIHEKCLMFVIESKDWESANDHCNNLGGGGLATNLDDCPLYEDLLWYIESREDLKNLYFWVGGSDLDVEGAWKWINGDHINLSAVYWGEWERIPEPSGGTGQNCLCLSREDRHSFWDNGCSIAHQFICQARSIVKD